VTVDADVSVRVCVSPVLRGFQRRKFGHYQATDKSGFSRVIGIDSRMRPCNEKASLRCKCLQSGEMCFACPGAEWEALIDVFADDRIPHQSDSGVSITVSSCPSLDISQKPCAIMNTKVNASSPKTLKLTQNCSLKL